MIFGAPKDSRLSKLQYKILKFISNNTSIGSTYGNLSLYDKVKNGWIIPNNSVLIPRLKTELNIQLEKNKLYDLLEEFAARKLINIESGHAYGEQENETGEKIMIANDFDSKFFSITIQGLIHLEVYEDSRCKKVKEKILFVISILAFVISIISVGIGITNCRRQEKEINKSEQSCKVSIQTLSQRNL